MKFSFSLVVILAVVLPAILSFFLLDLEVPSGPEQMEPHEVAEILLPSIEQGEFPSEIEIPYINLKNEWAPKSASVEFTIDHEAQKYIQGLFRRHKPDYGAFVALDAETGEILTLLSYSKRPHQLGNLALRATFPAASVFKIVTAAAAVDKGKVSAETVIPYNGRNHTLYKSNVYRKEENRWTRHMPLKKAFGRSINTVFGKLGIFHVGPENLNEYAERFGFNRLFDSDISFDPGEALISSENDWSIAESASGFTRKTKMSPLQGALIAGAVANDGAIMKPYIVRSILQQEEGGSELVYQPQRKIASVTMDQVAAGELRTMMSETVLSGTTRKIFRPFLRNPRFKDIEVGGKTGSLTGSLPRGKCDWFVGYAQFPGSSRKVAIAALTVHEKYWTVRSAYLARRYIEKYSRILHQKIEKQEVL